MDRVPSTQVTNAPRADAAAEGLTEQELAEIEVYVDNATVGPWRSTGHVLDPVYHANIWTEAGAIGGTDMAHDANFIAVARTAVPQLIAEVRRLQRALQGGGGA